MRHLSEGQLRFVPCVHFLIHQHLIPLNRIVGDLRLVSGLGFLELGLYYKYISRGVHTHHSRRIRVRSSVGIYVIWPYS